MRLSELEPCFIKITSPDGSSFRDTDLIDEADGICFLCPKCFMSNHGPIGTHVIICWRPRVSKDISPGPGRWEFEGTGFDDLTLRAGSSSVLLNDGCRVHFFITHGGIVSV